MKKILMALTILCSLPVFASPIEMAVTVDDLPVHMDLPEGKTRLDVAKKMLAAFDKHGLKNIYGFINAGHINNDSNNYKVLELWVNSGQLLGNHTYDHANLNKVSATDYIKQIQLNNFYLKKIMGKKNYHYFRYPYLYEGNTQAKRDKVRHYLADNQYKIAQVTMDFQDYLWNNAYTRCLKKQDKQSIAWLKKSYIEQGMNSITIAHELSMATLHRNIKNILLLHIGYFDALMLDDLLTAYEKHGVKFIPLSVALQDKAYDINPNIISENTGGFLEQLVHAKKSLVSDSVKQLIEDIPEKKLLHLC